MRRIVWGMAVSLDGFIEGLQGETDWMTYDPEDNPEEYLHRFDTFLLGRKSYEAMVRYNVGPNSFPGITCYVFSNSLERLASGFNLVTEKAVAFALKLKDQKGKDIAIYGGAEFGSALAKAGLVDEIVFSLQPVLIGKGKPFFIGLEERLWLTLKKKIISKTGTILHYDVKP